MRKSVGFLIIICFSVSLISAQNLTQTIKGTARDRESQVTLPGANVIIPDTDPLLETITDSDGRYIIENVPVGRHDIQISYLGYEPLTIPEIMVGTGKEVVINAGLKESPALLPLESLIKEFMESSD